MNRFAALVTLLFAALLLAACGSDSGSDDGGGGDGGTKGAAQLDHIDGPITLEGDSVTVTPSTGDGPETFTLGPAVKQGALQALVASKAKARIFYNPSDTEPVAVSVVSAPTIDSSAQYYDGTISRVTENQIAISGSDGTRTFEIRSQEREAFDLAHLKEHQDEKSPIRLYYVKGYAVAYEDA